MSTTMDDLQRRMEAMETELRTLRQRLSDAMIADRPPQNGTVLEWMAAIRRRDAETLDPLHEQVLQALGVPPHLPHVGARKVQEMMLADGVRPEECLGSREVVRMREE